MSPLRKQLKFIQTKEFISVLNRWRRSKTKKPSALKLRGAKVVPKIDSRPSEASSPIAPIKHSITPVYSSNPVTYTVERAAFAQHKPELLRQHPGKYVVFVGEDMIGPFDTFLNAVKGAYQKHGRRPIYTKQLIHDDSSR